MTAAITEKTPEEGFREKRSFKRRHLIYYLRVYDGVSSRVVGHIVDISPHGFMLISDEPVAAQEEYRLRMKLPGLSSVQEELIFEAVCRWCREDDNPAFFVAGFQIHNLLPEEATYIQSLIDDFGV